MNPTDIEYNIADWALAGNKLNEIDICLWYMNPFRPTCPNTFPYNGTGSIHTRLGDHCFYRPTALYSNTQMVEMKKFHQTLKNQTRVAINFIKNKFI